jgi:putative membrane protein
MKIFMSLIAGSALLLLTQFRPAADSPDQEFVTNAAQGGMLEVELGKLASQRGQSPKVKAFGKTMITDHTKVNDELKAIAGKKQITVPKQLSAAKQQQYDSLASQNGEKFDMLYMNMMIASHEQTIGLFQTESTKGQDAELKKWADSKIPALKHHLEMAKGLFKASSNATH